jgi:Na+/H+-dicarboxylate symporter
MSATTKLVFFGVVGGLTSSSDARAHLRVAWRTFLVQLLLIMIASLLFTLRGINQRSEDSMVII